MKQTRAKHAVTMRKRSVATCALATCRLAGALCCSACDHCGKHTHSHF